MKVLLLNQHAVESMLPMADCVPLMRRALEALSRGDAVLPLRSMLRLHDG